MRYLFLAAIFFSLSSLYTNAATYTVTNTNDNGSGSLREAIATANSTVADDLIVFNISGCPNGVCTIVLTSDQMVINASSSAGTLTISNPAGPQSLIVSGDNYSRIFRAVSGSSLTIDGLTLENGYGVDGFESSVGGALRNEGSANISNSVFRSNYGYYGGAIWNGSGTLVLTNSEIINNGASAGGGIYSIDGPLLIRDSTIANNGSTYGGGVAIFAVHDYSWTATFANSTFSGNWTAGPFYDGFGGAVYLATSSASVSFINVTMTQNVGYGGGVAGDPAIGASMNVRNSIISANIVNDDPVYSDIHNVLVNNVGHNIISQPALLGPLSNNGGPTRTHALLSGSPAINAGNNCVLTENGCGDGNPALPTDQRGSGRFGNVDIGAFELHQTSSTTASPFDFDGDGKTDIGIFRPASAEWWYSRSSDNQVAATQFGQTTDKITPGDFTGDGKADIAVWRPSTGEWFVLRSEDGSFFSFPFGTNGDVPVPADYDADGKTDAAVYRPSTNTWFILQSGGGGTRINQFGAAGDVPVVADYDGDGQADIAIFRPGPGEWWISRSTAGILAFQLGAGTDKPVQGDYTGDGKADAAFFRPSTGFWYIIRSEDFSFYSVPFGTNGDVPAPGDYDGDGKFDTTVFRPSQATWFINRTTAGTLITQFGANGDQPIPNAFVP
jgi:hypothetical protein